MEKIDEDVLKAIRVMQMAKRAAKIFPEGISKMEVYEHLIAGGQKISFRILDGVYDRLKAGGTVRVYPTMHDVRAVIKDL